MSDDEQQEVYDDENVGDEVEAEQDEQQGDTEEQTGDAPVEATIKKPKNNPLTKEKLEKGLSVVAKAADGLSYAFVKLDVQKKKLTDVSILEGFKYLRQVDLSHNFINEITVLSSMPNLIQVNVSHNDLLFLDIPKREYLQELSAANNKITSVKGIAQPRLKSLNLSNNKIPDALGLSHSDVPVLEVLELRGNLLVSPISIRLATLTTLYLAANRIADLEGLSSLVNLKRLHLRDNQLKSLKGFTKSNNKLEYVNLRNNVVEEVAEFHHLALLPKLSELVLSGNPVSALPAYRLEPLVLIRHLTRLDKNKYDEDETHEAKEIRDRRDAAKRQQDAQEREVDGREETVSEDV